MTTKKKITKCLPCAETGFDVFQQKAKEMLELYKIYFVRLVKLINRDELKEYGHLVDCFNTLSERGVYFQYKFELAHTQFHMEDVLAGTKAVIDDMFAIDCFLFRCFAAGYILLSD